MIRAVIFDFDGLIVDTEWPAYAAWCQIFQRYGQVLPLDQWVATVGTFQGFDPVAYLTSLTGGKYDAEVLFAEKEQLKAEACNSAPILPGVQDRIAEARRLGAKVAVVSTSDRQWVEGHLRRVKLWPNFDVVVTREDVKKVKPDPEPYLNAAAKLGLDPAECLVFEDSMNGVKAAKAAGMKCVAVPSRVTEFLDFSIADRRVRSLAEFTLADLP